jgi:predicted alpha/beta-hydrolase family hydrolase
MAEPHRHRRSPELVPHRDLGHGAERAIREPLGPVRAPARLTVADAGAGADTVPTSRGLGRFTVTVPTDTVVGGPTVLVVLGHGAGGSVEAPDLVSVTSALVARGAVVALVTQPYRVAGRRSPAPAAHLDEAWSEIVAVVRTRYGGLPLVVGGRSSGARVACRTAAATGAVAVVALAFPTHPPGRPERSREPELATGVPTLVVNGDRDPFGIPATAPGVTVEVVAGADHSLSRARDAVAALTVGWLSTQGLLH